MTRGTILNAARRGNKGPVVASAILLAACLVVLGVYWREVSAFATGPYQYVAAVSKAPRLDANLYVLIAAALAAISLISLAGSWRGASNPNRHSAFKRLKSKGDAAQIAMKVEDELISARKEAKAGPLYITKSWMVAVEPVLLIYPMADLMGVGHREKTSKSGTQHSLIVWQRGVNLNDVVSCKDEADSTVVITRLAEKAPWVLVSDPDSFDKRWRQQREQTEKEVDERRLHVSRAG